ncbi:DUF3096 domain-containing protein [Chloroflexota bacterium]
MLPFGPIMAILAIIFGVCIIAFPQILAYMIGSFFIIMGILYLSGRLQPFKRK